MDQTQIAPAVPPPPAAQSKGLIGQVLGFLTKYKKYVIIVALIVVGWFLWNKYGPKKPAPPQTLPKEPQVQVPPPPAALDPNFTRLTAPTTP